MPVLTSVRQSGWTCELRVDEEEGHALPVTIGRSSELNIPPEETAISRNHAKLHRDDNGKLCLEALKKVWLRQGRSRKVHDLAPGSSTKVSSAFS